MKIHVHLPFRTSLEAEAREIGKAAAGLLTVAKKKDNDMKGAAAAKRTRARKSAAAAQLDTALAAIDAERDEKRAALWGAPAHLPIPTAPLVQQRSRPPPEPKPKPAAVDDLSTDLTAARAALTAAMEMRSLERISSTRAQHAHWRS